MDRVVRTIPSAGHCNTMGTATSMNSLAEALGMSLPGCATIPARTPSAPRWRIETGKRIVEMVREDLTPSRILTRAAFENAIVANSAIGGSTNCPPHITAIARHVGVEVSIQDWEKIGHEMHLLVNVAPAGELPGRRISSRGRSAGGDRRVDASGENPRRRADCDRAKRSARIAAIPAAWITT